MEDRARAVGRDIRTAQALRDIHVARAELSQVAGQTDVHRLARGFAQVVHVQGAELLIDNAAGSGGRGFEIVALVFQNLLHLLAARVVGEKRDGAVAVGEKVDLVADPHGVIVVGVLARDFQH